MSFPSQQFMFSNHSTQLNVAFINIEHLPKRKNGNDAVVGIFGLAVSVLLLALQLKYHGSTNSPFQDHPKAMAIAIASCLIFCLGCDVQQYVQETLCSSTFETIFHHILRVLAFISLASLASIIFSASTISTTSVIVYLIFPCFFSASLPITFSPKSAISDESSSSNLIETPLNWLHIYLIHFLACVPQLYTAKVACPNKKHSLYLVHRHYSPEIRATVTVHPSHLSIPKPLQMRLNVDGLTKLVNI
ncbi:hypothetical protein POM88_002648 [Heracleum sosnowskyi]|uniref:Transmembrane protein n=1 Tax=Heracleum sosnowskyi TaxID=360622 RepID=A0AAD8JFX4_9APIA|nr:hypothetical protein POM88_002648 [Heracleum sosnowskyi]